MLILAQLKKERKGFYFEIFPALEGILKNQEVPLLSITYVRAREKGTLRRYGVKPGEKRREIPIE